MGRLGLAGRLLLTFSMLVYFGLDFVYFEQLYGLTQLLAGLKLLASLMVLLEENFFGWILTTQLLLETTLLETNLLTNSIIIGALLQIG
mmetsp:Transcript_3990/g.6044  ORF Transcript_3990/g.6044 Transcript_3990/m.6044 type:complete len:89 (-) Transcript_3990:1026-1292(-)